MDIDYLKKELSDLRKKISEEESREGLIFYAGRLVALESIISSYEKEKEKISKLDRNISEYLSKTLCGI